MASVPDGLRAALPDHYRIKSKVGSGAMATVYLADDVKHGRQVAVKVLRPELAGTLLGERFLNEIQIAAQLNHPNILPLHDSGTSGGFLYYVMPYVEGESLRERLSREKQLPIKDALRIATEVADGLAYAHANGVVHRDIKPGNILMSEGHAVGVPGGANDRPAGWQTAEQWYESSRTRHALRNERRSALASFVRSLSRLPSEIEP